MNIALPAIIAFIIILPGFAFRSRLQLVEGTKVDYSPFGQVATEAVVWAGVMHLIMLGLSYLLFDKTIHVDVLVRLLSTGAIAKDHALLAKDAPWIAAYFFSILMLSIGLSSLVKHLVSRYRLDRANGRFSKLFRFRRAPWYYLLSGADFAKDETPDFIQIAAVVQLDGESFIYQGILEHYYTDETGQLDRLVISNASRRSLKNDDVSLLARGPHKQELAPDSAGPTKRKKSRTTARFYPIIGDYFILHYDEVVTLNVRYIKLVTEPQ